jgi:hypothetical protein
MAGEERGVDAAYVAQMRELAGFLDTYWNGPPQPGVAYDRKTGFCLFVFSFDAKPKEGRVNYISNAEREDMIKSVEAWLLEAKAGKR